MTPVRKKCLIVDGSAVVRSIVRAALTQIGVECLEAESGESALALCKNSMPDVIVLDWNLPAMNGTEFLHRLRSLPGGEHPRVIASTSAKAYPAARDDIGRDTDDYIIKPFNNDVLEAKISIVDDEKKD